jgi:integrase
MKPRDLPVPALLVVETKDGSPVWEAKWRSGGEQVKRRLGPALLRRRPADDPSAGDGWRARWEVPVTRSGRPQRGKDGTLGVDEAIALAGELVDHVEVQRAAQRREADRIAALGGHDPTLAEAAEIWLDNRERVKGLRISTLREYRSVVDVHLLTSPHLAGPIAGISTGKVIDWRDELDARRDEEGERIVSRRTINKARMVLHGIFEFACRPIDQKGYGLLLNPVKHCEPLGEEPAPEREPLTPGEVMLVVGVLRAGGHRITRARGGATSRKPEAQVERDRENEQDAAMVMLLAFCGLRVGEAAALRWRHVEFASSRLRIDRSWNSTNLVETPTKAGEARWTVVPDQVAAVLDGLSRRPYFTGRDDLVFCSAVGKHVDLRAFRRRFRAACEAAGIQRHMRVHDLRHGATTDLRSVFDADAVRKLVGHKDARTAQRYAHARDQSDAAARWTKYLDDMIGAGE